jgi:hypothetical protein
LGFEKKKIEEKNTTNPNNKSPRRIPQLVSNVVAYCWNDDVDGVLHIFITQSKTLKEAKDSWLNSCLI